MSERRPEPDLDQVRRAMREHDAQRDAPDEERDEPPEEPSESSEEDDDHAG